MDLELLERTLADAGEPSFRATQIWEWAAGGAHSFGQMTNLPKALRDRLMAELPFSTLEAADTATSSDGTEKVLFNTLDGRPLETVLMRYRDGRCSICVSSQSGCPLTCNFCATGRMAFGRNLTASEILDQVLHFRRSGSVNHLVFMGMGEPMMNLDAVIEASERLPDIGVATSHTTVSTVGWIPGIERLATEGPRIRLALSVHSAEEDVRSELMPVNDRYPLRDVLEACLRWREKRGKRVYIEYLMLGGVNDAPDQAVALAEALKPREAWKVNLIPYNPTPGGYRASEPEMIDAFRAVLRERGIPSTVRLTRGRDIAAACGQLAVEGAVA
ncbi:MAG: 23S rRNA (adenine(2503)-C(2))-methyltransferase RlmN [Solirubrobacterales bacterium]